MFSISSSAPMACALDQTIDNVLKRLLAEFGLIAVLLVVQMRRFQHQHQLGSFVSVNPVPYVGVIIVAMMMLTKGTQGTNRFGPDTKAS